MAKELYLANGRTLHRNYKEIYVIARNIYEEHVESSGEKGKEIETYK